MNSIRESDWKILRTLTRAPSTHLGRVRVVGSSGFLDDGGVQAGTQAAHGQAGGVNVHGQGQADGVGKAGEEDGRRDA